MAPTVTRRINLSLAALVLAAVFLLVPQAQAAKPPSLQSTPQYKALVSYVATLKKLQSKPATAAKKESYTAELTTRHNAAVNRSNALFIQGQKEAKSQTQAKFQADSKEVRAAEAQNLADLRSEYADKLANADSRFQDDVDGLQEAYKNLRTRLQKQVRILRMKKAKAKGIERKTQIQGQINTLVEQINNGKQQELTTIANLKDRYTDQVAAIKKAKASDTAEVRDSSQKAIDRLRKEAASDYNQRVSALKKRRTNQQATLTNKLNEGRLYISFMPVSG